MEKQIQKVRQLPNKIIYAAFLVAALAFAVLKDFSTAVIFGGVGLAFDPFNEQVAFNKRPLWRKLWLLCHIIIVLVILGLSLKRVL